jgi:hypothetical protein
MEDTAIGPFFEQLAGLEEQPRRGQPRSFSPNGSSICSSLPTALDQPRTKAASRRVGKRIAHMREVGQAVGSLGLSAGRLISLTPD